MLMTVDELRQFVDTDEEDQVLEAKLQALELLIRSYTNNNFQVRAFRAVAVAEADNSLFVNTPIPFRAGDTLQITESELQPNALVTVTAVADGVVSVSEDIYEESGVVITKVVYPQDVKMGVAAMLKWMLKNEAANNGDKEQKDVQSETISRHSVTYVTDTTEADLDEHFGVPKKHTAFLKPYKRARFGQGVRV